MSTKQEEKMPETHVEMLKKKYAAELKAAREKDAKEEQKLLLRVARLFEERDPERFTEYREYAAQLIEQEREKRAERAKKARVNRNQQRDSSDAAQQHESSDAAVYAGSEGGYAQ